MDIKRLFRIAVFALATVSGSVTLADTYVNGYYRGDRTYVQPHYRSSPNSTKTDSIGNQYHYDDDGTTTRNRRLAVHIQSRVQSSRLTDT